MMDDHGSSGDNGSGTPAGGGKIPVPYLKFLERDLPFPDYDRAYISELRVQRQIINEAFVKTSDKARARLDLASLRELVADCFTRSGRTASTMAVRAFASSAARRIKQDLMTSFSFGAGPSQLADNKSVLCYFLSILSFERASFSFCSIDPICGP